MFETVKGSDHKINIPGTHTYIHIYVYMHTYCANRAVSLGKDMFIICPWVVDITNS